MTPVVIGTVTIGQAPRPDLLEPLLDRIDPRRVEVRQYGALDEVDPESLPAGSIHAPSSLPMLSMAPPASSAPTGDDRYPLTTRLGDGRSVTLDETFLAPLVQAAVERAERDGAAVTLLLCAGGFAGVESSRPLVRPFELAVAVLSSMGLPDIAVAVPLERQVLPAERKYLAAGFWPIVRAAAPAEAPSVFGGEIDGGSVGAVVLDYVGHSLDVVAELRQVLPCPLVDLGDLAAAAVAASV